MRLKHFNVAFGEQVFKALGDESRIRLLNLIYRNKEMCISDLEQILDFTQTKVSRHLIYLKNAGLVSFRRVDNWAYYYLKEETEDLLSQIFGYLEKDALLLKDQEVYNVLYSNRELAVCKLHSRRWQG
ncbi:winged helix-turn-helix transcriptional regulator [Adhaeribacter sp. BT258]|uniref:Winged helix-turn-helix transcriptional regulator n=1 Tax=Adhaeribacter terrigena TaxID=2793070 RepID=A0ABS1BZ32_9BACT|nr:metalloregulator ArsR/SmtB family transcription factor [Adhaeribacter terrigena]MBK0401643.1 winged helix-turn-helix transcriptional regulator [Adhaeribacter terrigena]